MLPYSYSNSNSNNNRSYNRSNRSQSSALTLLMNGLLDYYYNGLAANKSMKLLTITTAIITLFIFIIIYISHSNPTAITTADNNNPTANLISHTNIDTVNTVTTDTATLWSDDSLINPKYQSIPLSYRNLTHLILVACHTVLNTYSNLNTDTINNPSNWELDYYQLPDLPIFIKHIQKGLELLESDPTALLLYSGGQTKSAVGPRSEAASYYIANNLLNPSISSTVKQRIQLEESALDSYQNLLFSICRFTELTGEYPKLITIISFQFKSERFIKLHSTAIRWTNNENNNNRLNYIGIDPDTVNDNSAHLNQLIAAESKYSYQPFTTDPYGCNNSILLEKRLKRNPFRNSISYSHGSSCPELRELLHYCGPELYTGKLPWD